MVFIEYCINQIELVNNNLKDLSSPGYFWFFCTVLVYLYRVYRGDVKLW